MPPKKRRAHRHRSDLTKNDYRALRRGWGWPFIPGRLVDPNTGEADIEACREVWDAIGDDLTTEFIDENPGQRPWAWWMFTAPEPARRLLSGPGLACTRDPAASAKSKRLSFGVPVCYRHEDMETPSVYETEVQFLDRHGLLTDSERSALAIGSV